MARKFQLCENGWKSVDDIARMCSWAERTVREHCESGYYGQHQRIVWGVGGESGRQYQIHISSPLIPPDVRAAAYREMLGLRTPEYPLPDEDFDPSTEMMKYNMMPDYARRRYNKYLNIIRLCDGLSKKDMIPVIAQWNSDHPDKKTSLRSVYEARKAYENEGIEGIAGKWGSSAGTTTVRDDLYAVFKQYYMGEGCLNFSLAWRLTFGWAAEHLGIDDPKELMRVVRGVTAYKSRLQNETPADAADYARRGHSRWNRRYGPYIIRDRSKVLAGQCFVADHAQLDAIVSYRVSGELRFGVPWITVWRDFKSGMWVGYDLYIGNPNSDHIFSAFSRAATDYGVPSIIYTDNGKDFRSRDLTGGRKRFRLTLDEDSSRSLAGGLGMQVIFAQPYNAQSKPIERDFRNMNHWLARMARGYRGGNVVERPEGLNKTIKNNDIDTIEEMTAAVDLFVRDVMNGGIIEKGDRAGKSPRQIWDEEAPIAAERGLLRQVTADALALFRMRSSSTLTIGRNGIYDSELKMFYYDEWMIGMKDRAVYLRRDPLRYAEGWVFDTATNAFLGRGSVLPKTPALAETEEERAILAGEIRRVARSKKITRSLATADVGDRPGIVESTTLLARATKILSGAPPTDAGPQRIGAIMATAMDHVLAEDARRSAEGQSDIPIRLTPEKAKKKVYTLLCEREDDEAEADSPEESSVSRLIGI